MCTASGLTPRRYSSGVNYLTNREANEGSEKGKARVNMAILAHFSEERVVSRTLPSRLGSWNSAYGNRMMTDVNEG